VGRVLQRKCDCEGGACSKCGKGEVPEERRKQLENIVQRQGEGEMAEMPERAEQAMRRSGEGTPLDRATRDLMESRFGQDFGDVRLHADAGAADAARSLRATAFTTGRDIYFAEGKYDPKSEEGRRLLAHELTHVAQQRSGEVKPTPGATVVGPADDAFEREADRAADSVVRGAAAAPVGRFSPAPVTRRKGIEAADLKDTNKIVTLPESKPLNVPAEKGPVKDEYRDALKNKSLTPLAKFSRPSTSTLRSIWQDKYGGESVFDETLKPGGDVCEVDHKVELQVGGSNNKENLQLLEKGHNASSGSQMRVEVERARADYDDDQVIRFSKVVFGKTPVSAKNDQCIAYEDTLEKRAAGKVADVKFGARAVDIDLPKPEKAGGKLYDIAGRRSQIVAGLDFSKLTWSTVGQKAEVGSQIDANLVSGATKFIKNKKRAVVLDIAENKIVAFGPDYKALNLVFPFMSEARLDMNIDEKGMVSGAGKFTPTVPLFNRTQIALKIEGGKFTGGAKFTQDQLNLPIPGVTITECTIEVSLDDGEFSAAGVLAFKLGSFIDARLDAKVDRSGLVLVGKANFLIPGLDTAEGKITYRDKKLTGDIKIGKDKFKLPGVKSANIHIHITDTEATGTGVVLLNIPGIKEGTLGFAADKTGNYAITGAAKLDIPGVEQAELGLSIVNGELEGFGRLGLSIPGFESAGAQFELRYAKGLLTGSGAFRFKKGKLAGQVNVALNDKRKLTGTGELAYEVTPGFTAAVSVELLEDATLKYGGELRFPEAIELFKVKPYDKTLFKRELTFPLFAIPGINAGVVAELGGSLKAKAGIGPGTLGLKAKLAPFDPTQEEQALDFSAGATLNIPAFAELAFTVYGGVGLSAAIAEVTGGIELVTTVGVRGGLTADATLSVQNGQIAVAGVLELKVQPSIRFDVNAYVSVEIDLWIDTWEVYSKRWNLASKEWGSGLEFGLRFPVQYVFGQPFDLSLDQVEFIYPEIDIMDVVSALLPF
jgi:hypothetical protein